MENKTLDFENNQLLTDQIPRIDQVVYEPIEKNYLWMSLVQNAIFLMVLFGVGMIFLVTVFLDSFFLNLIKFMGAWLIFAIVLITLSWMGFYRKGFALRERDVTYKTGLIFKSITTIPFNRVQHCELKKGPMEEMFSISRLRIYTAGGMASDLSIPGLDPVKAESMKQFILKKTEEDEEE
jgi:membrane protein YdbS with pleckstrin-like domain